VPINQSFVYTIFATNITGYYDIDLQYTTLQVWADSLNVTGTAIQTQVSYDFDGNGVYDRIELYDFFTPDNLPGMEKFFAKGLPEPPNPGLVGPAPAAWANLVNGVVRVQFWQALTSFVPSYIRTDSDPGMDTIISIPFITAWRIPYVGVGACGNVVAPPTTGIATTFAVSTAAVTTSPLPVTSGSQCVECGLTTTAKATTSHLTTGHSTTGSVSRSTTGAMSGGSTTADLCTGYTCPSLPSNPICKIPGGTCHVTAGVPTCSYVNAADGSTCSVNQPPNLCYTGTCLNGACSASGNTNNCNGKVSGASTLSASASLAFLFVLVLII